MSNYDWFANYLHWSKLPTIGFRRSRELVNLYKYSSAIVSLQIPVNPIFRKDQCSPFDIGPKYKASLDFHMPESFDLLRVSGSQILFTSSL